MECTQKKINSQKSSIIVLQFRGTKVMIQKRFFTNDGHGPYEAFVPAQLFLFKTKLFPKLGSASEALLLGM